MAPKAPQLEHAAWHRAIDTRDPAFDGVFYVAIKSTRVYCRNVCPSRLARPENRRFYDSIEAAVAAGNRACKRCRPELHAGDSPLEAVPRLAKRAAARISGGDLNERSVRELARSMGMSDRHVRRAVHRVHGTSPVRLALAQRLRTATGLLSDERRTITQVAYSSGFGSLRRFNAAFRERFEMTPSEWRRRRTATATDHTENGRGLPEGHGGRRRT